MVGFIFRQNVINRFSFSVHGLKFCIKINYPKCNNVKIIWWNNIVTGFEINLLRRKNSFMSYTVCVGKELIVPDKTSYLAIKIIVKYLKILTEVPTSSSKQLNELCCHYYEVVFILTR